MTRPRRALACIVGLHKWKLMYRVGWHKIFDRHWGQPREVHMCERPYCSAKKVVYQDASKFYIDGWAPSVSGVERHRRR